MSTADPFRTPGRIRKIESGPYREGSSVLTHWCHLDFDDSGGQGFGGLALDANLLAAYEKDLCAAFGVASTLELIGVEATALYSFDGLGEGIEGLGAPNGRRFTLTGFRRRHCGANESPLQTRRASLLDDIKRFSRDIAAKVDQLVGLSLKFRDWEEP